VRQSTDERKSWVYQTPARTNCRLRLFCFPYAGGGAAVYRLWAAAMPPDVELCRIQLPGRESRLSERPMDRLPALVNELMAATRPLLDVPFAFFGHSMGALVSFELARALRREYGLAAEHLFASAWRAPQLPLGTQLHRLPESEFIDRLQARFSGIPEGVLRDRELLDMMLPVLRADLAVCETYEYSDEAPFGCPISVFGGVDDHWVNASELAAWSVHTTRSMNVTMFPGDHFFISDGRQRVPQQVAEILVGEFAAA